MYRSGDQTIHYKTDLIIDWNNIVIVYNLILTVWNNYFIVSGVDICYNSPLKDYFHKTNYVVGLNLPSEC